MSLPASPNRLSRLFILECFQCQKFVDGAGRSDEDIDLRNIESLFSPSRSQSAGKEIDYRQPPNIFVFINVWYSPVTYRDPKF